MEDFLSQFANPVRPPMMGQQQQPAMYPGMDPKMFQLLAGGGRNPVDQAFNQYAGDLRATEPEPKNKLAHFLGSALLPAVVGGLAGGSPVEAAIYGTGTAANKYSNHKSKVKDIEQQIAAAKMGLPLMRQDYRSGQLNNIKTMQDIMDPGRGQKAFDPGALQKKIDTVSGITGGAKPGDKAFDDAWAKYASPAEQQMFATNRMPGESVDAYERRLAYAKGEGAASGKLQPEAQRQLASTFADLQQTKAQYTDLAAMLDGLPTGPMTGDIKGRFDSDFQRVRATLYSNALRNIGTLAAQGIRLNPITQEELEVLFATQPQLSNDPKANAQIIKDELRKINRIEKDIRSQIDHIHQGKPIETWVPESYYDAPQSSAPTTTPSEPTIVGSRAAT